MEGCEFEPRYSQRVVNLGKSLYLACFVDPSAMGTCLGECHNLSAHRFAPVIGHWLQKSLVKGEMVLMIS